MTDAEHAFGFGAGRQNSLGAGYCERQGLFAEYLFAGFEARDDHLLVQRMRRHHRDGIDVRPREQRLVVAGEVEFMGRRERCRHFRVDVAAGHHLEARAVGQAHDDLLAPPAEPDNADPDHVASFPRSTEVFGWLWSFSRKNSY